VDFEEVFDFEDYLVDQDFEVNQSKLIQYKISFCIEEKEHLPFDTWLTLVMERDLPLFTRRKFSLRSSSYFQAFPVRFQKEIEENLAGL
jgi:hypothetical protein